MKKPIRKSLLEQILHGNIRVIGFFVLLVWAYTVFLVTQTTYQTEFAERKSDFSMYVDSVEETLNQAVIHSEHIVQSSYISDALKKTEYSADEMLEMLDYSKEILLSSTVNQNSPKIYTTNEALFESNWFSHVSNLPNYREILQAFESKKSDIVFDKSVQYFGENVTEIVMYRRLPRNPGSILRYRIQVLHPESLGYPMEIVFSVDPRVQDTENYISLSVNDSLSCMMKIPKEELYAHCLQVVLTGLVILLVLFVLIIFLSRNTAKKTLREIYRFMGNLDGEDLLYDSEFFRTEYDLKELNTIKQTLHKLSLELKEYHDAIQAAELENKQLEMERLSMQLDPHMLYNSLSAIRLDAYRIQNQKIMNLVDNMALYYREILKKDRKYISVADEMETVRKYLFINELSHEKQYPLTTEIEPHLLNLPIPPQFFHTFVENCVVHGLSGSRENCLIKISIREEDGYIISEIYDNGYGMTPERLATLNEGNQEQKHIGISNSLKRMKLFFGEESSIRFESEKNNYTRVIIRFKKPAE